MALKYRVFLHSYLGFNSSSTLIYGERDGILVDASQLLSDSYHLVGEIIKMRINLTYIYVSHFHPDHHFGLQVLHQAFPKAKIIGLAQSVHDLVDTTNDKLDMWSCGRFGIAELPERTVIPFILREPHIELEGEEICFQGGYEGDSVNNSIVWVPSMKLLCATDVAFHDCNLWPIESNVERRVRWRKDIARLREFDPRVVVPGHFADDKAELLAAASENEKLSYTDCLQWSIDYLDHYDYVYDTAKTGKELVDMMTARYDLKAEDFAIHWQARLLFPQSSPDWLTPLPGKRGEIFLNPQGGFDGDPAKEEE